MMTHTMFHRGKLIVIGWERRGEVGDEKWNMEGGTRDMDGLGTR